MTKYNPLFPPNYGYATPALEDKGTQIMEGLLLNQYQNSPNLKEYLNCFVAELDFLFQQVELVHQGRFIQNAVGNQLDIVGILLQQNRAVALPTIWFGFQGAVNVEGMADEATPALGGLFRDANVSEGTIVPLGDTRYRRLLLAKALVLNRDTADVNLAYYFISILLGRVPRVIQLKDVDTPNEVIQIRTVELLISEGDTTSEDIQMIYYSAKYFVPAGITFTITRV